MFKQNKNLLIIALIAIVNALGYGIIIPILYSYSVKYGLNDFQNGLLFSVFSICQFFATPVIGRMSDKYGRKPLLVVSLSGTALSFLMMAFAPNALFLFLARALDGITAGNLPVAQAVISDSTVPQDRAKGFGIIGASFGFGFIFGPAISALTLRFGDNVPFLIAAAVTIVSVLLTAIILPETNKHMGEVQKGKLFDFKKLIHSIFDPAIGKTLLISFLYMLAFAMFIYAFQPFATKILFMNATQISLIFTVVGVMGLITQIAILPRVVKSLGDRKTLSGAFLIAVGTFLAMFLSRTVILYFLIVMVNAVANSFVNPLVQTLLSREVDAKSQGSIMGLNASYQSLGFIFGPILGGILATWFVPLPFLGGSLIILACFLLSLQILKRPLHKQSTF